MPYQIPHSKKAQSENELALFLNSLEKNTRDLLTKCLHLHGEDGDILTVKHKIEQIRSAL